MQLESNVASLRYDLEYFLNGVGMLGLSTGKAETFSSS